MGEYVTEKKKNQPSEIEDFPPTGTMQHYVVYVRNDERTAKRKSARYHAVAGLLLVAVVVALVSSRYALLPL